MTIRTDCNISMIEKYKNKYPNAIFEIITRDNDHALSPSFGLLSRYKEGYISFQTFCNSFLLELKLNLKAKQEIVRLKKLSLKHTIFLVCYEKNPKLCHRSIVEKLLNGEL